MRTHGPMLCCHKDSFSFFLLPSVSFLCLFIPSSAWYVVLLFLFTTKYFKILQTLISQFFSFVFCFFFSCWMLSKWVFWEMRLCVSSRAVYDWRACTNMGSTWRLPCLYVSVLHQANGRGKCILDGVCTLYVEKTYFCNRMPLHTVVHACALSSTHMYTIHFFFQPAVHAQAPEIGRNRGAVARPKPHTSCFLANGGRRRWHRAPFRSRVGFSWHNATIFLIKLSSWRIYLFVRRPVTSFLVSF